MRTDHNLRVQLLLLHGLHHLLLRGVHGRGHRRPCHGCLLHLRVLRARVGRGLALARLLGLVLLVDDAAGAAAADDGDADEDGGDGGEDDGHEPPNTEK